MAGFTANPIRKNKATRVTVADLNSSVQQWVLAVLKIDLPNRFRGILYLDFLADCDSKEATRDCAVSACALANTSS